MGGEFSIGSVVGQAFRLLRENLGVILLLGLLLSALPQGLIAGSTAPVVRFMVLRGMDPRVSTVVIGLLAFIVSLIASTILQGAVIDRLAGRPGAGPVGLGASLATGCRLFFPLLGIGFLVTLGCFLGLILLVVPGLMLLCRWSVSSVAEVVERTGVRGSMGRSRDLTKGHRWRVFGSLLIFIVIMGLIAGGQFLLVRALDLSNPTVSSPAVIAFQVVGALVSMVTSLLFTAVSVAIYIELRRAKEGGTLSEIASVFT